MNTPYIQKQWGNTFDSQIYSQTNKMHCSSFLIFSSTKNMYFNSGHNDVKNLLLHFL